MNKKRGGFLLRDVIRRNRKYLLGASASALLSSLISMLIPLLLAETVDHVFGGADSKFPYFFTRTYERLSGGSIPYEVAFLALMTILFSLISGVFSYLKARWQAALGENTSRDLRDRLYAHLQHLPYSYHAKAETGDLVQRCTSDVETVRRFLAVEIMSVVSSASTIFIALSYLIGSHIPLTLYSLMLVPALFLVAWLFFKWVIKRFEETDEAEGAMSSILQESITGVRVVRSFGRQNYEEEKFEKSSAAFRNKFYATGKLMAMYWAATDMISSAQCLITLVMCVVYSVKGEISVGTAIVFTTYVARMLWPVRQLGRVMANAGKANVALSRMADILDAEPEKPEAGEKPSLRGDIVFDHVTFRYGEDEPVLKDFSVTLPGGKTIGILGPTGSGKSTLALLLQRLYSCNKGEIRISGVPICRIQRDYLRRHVGLILQEPFLYAKSLEENLKAAAPDTDRNTALKAARDAQAEEFILNSEKGLETLVGERGVTLSGGQKQRMAIARTLLKDNHILIFDDSLSAVDAQTDIAIRGALKKHQEGVTTLIISHRISTLKEADLILVIEDGAVSQLGTHDELLGKDGLYKRIFDIQANATA